ncbi:hypothetical protein N0V83_006355 [Neocucurbitaria cava]|uniref:Uncharacterized protein n=1 Tax=Neocucurbitaria cava TaxID=798079 RepID=A0A9W8Y5V1_9PLEO|nr:hypothetical protein N0V83_006355 [Neocucurbitaria cava]
MQIHSAVLSAASQSVSSPHRVGVATEAKDNANHDHQQYQQDLDTWLGDWKREDFNQPNMENEDDNHVTTSNRSSQCVVVLEAWAELNYHHAAQLLHYHDQPIPRLRDPLHKLPLRPNNPLMYIPLPTPAEITPISQQRIIEYPDLPNRLANSTRDILNWPTIILNFDDAAA